MPVPGVAASAPARRATAATPSADQSGRSGAAAEASAPATNGRLPWIVGGIAVAILLGVVLIPRMGADSAPPVANAPAVTGASTSTGDPRDIDLTTMTPEDAAIRLFTRVMTLAESGDSVQARTFAPMAIDAYGLVPELTLDHRYDIAMIHFVDGNPEAAAAQADTILAAAPTHLFGLAAAAEAAARTGDTVSARDYYQQFLDSYDSEIANNAVAYEMHAPLPPAIRMAAIAYLNATN